jgi:hypothetical protein
MHAQKTVGRGAVLALGVTLLMLLETPAQAACGAGWRDCGYRPGYSGYRPQVRAYRKRARVYAYERRLELSAPVVGLSRAERTAPPIPNGDSGLQPPVMSYSGILASPLPSRRGPTLFGP